MLRRARAAFLVAGLGSTALVLAAALAGCRGGDDALRLRMRVEEHRLPNGLRLLLSPDAAATTVSYQSWFRTGSVDEVPGGTGLAHLFEHLMFQGTPANPGKAFFRRLEARGAQVNAMTARDFTVYYANLAPELLETAVELESDRLRHLTLDEARLATEREVVLEERRLQVDNSPAGRMQESLWRLAFRRHPYGSPVIGWPEDLARTDTTTLRAFYDRHYQPGNLTLVVTGAFDARVALELIARHYGPIPGRPAAPRAIPPEPDPDGERRLRLEDGVGSERLLLGYRIPGAEHEDTPALDVLANILFAGTASRGWRRLVEERALMLGVSGSAYTPTYPGLFVISGTARSPATAEAAEAELSALLREVQREGVGEEEVARAVRQLTVSLVDSARTPFGVGQLLGTIAVTLGRMEGYERELARYLAVRPADVVRVARRHLIPNARVVVTLGPPATGAPGSRGGAAPSARSGVRASPIERSGGPGRRTQAEPTSVGTPLAEPEVERLPNGLTLAWFASDALPVIDLTLLIGSGSRDDAPGRAGTAELLAASLDRGAGALDADAFAREVERLGVRRQASAGEDSFVVGLGGLAPDAPRLVDLLADLSLAPTLAESEVARERERLVLRWRNVGDHPSALAGLAFHRSLTADTDYARGNLVSLRELAGLSRADVAGWHARHFTPANATLAVVGRFDRAALRARIGERFGAWRGDPPGRTRIRARTGPVVRGGELLLVDRPGVNQAQIRMGRLLPPARDPARPALAVVSALLGEHFGSRLNAELRDRLGLTYGIGSGLSYAAGQGRFQVSTSTRAEETGRMIVEIRRILARTAAGPLPFAETAVAREYLTGGYAVGLPTLGAVAARWLGLRALGLEGGELNTWVPRVATVTEAEAGAAARAALRPEAMLTVIAGDRRLVEPALRRHGLRARVVTPRELLGE